MVRSSVTVADGLLSTSAVTSQEGVIGGGLPGTGGVTQATHQRVAKMPTHSKLTNLSTHQVLVDEVRLHPVSFPQRCAWM